MYIYTHTYIYVYIYICGIMKAMCPPGYHHNCSCHEAIVVITGRAHCFHDNIYIDIYIYIYYKININESWHLCITTM